MMKSLFSTLLAAVALFSGLSCIGATKGNPLAGRWLITVPGEDEPMMLSIEGRNVSLMMDGMDGFEINATDAVVSDNTLSFTDESNSKCSLTYNPSDESVTLTFKHPGNGKTLKLKASGNQKLNGVRSESFEPRPLTIYSDRELTKKMGEVSYGSVIPYADVDETVWTILLPGDVVAYASRENSSFDYAAIPARYLSKSYVNSEGDYDESFSFEKLDNGKIAVCRNILPHNGRRASEVYLLAIADRNSILATHAGTYASVISGDTDALEALEKPLIIDFITYYGTPLLIVNGKNYNEQTF